jgi:NAD(P)-dependent dehydrogenase (short-subunit alcohol dehydrogenase family)
VRDGDAVARLRDAVQVRFGRADVLVNNAGRSMMKRFGETTDAEWREELDLKFFSLIHPTRAFLPMLQASDAAAIVCVNALLSVQPEPWLAATAAARAGALSLTKTLSLDLAAAGIRVNSVLLGVIESGQWQRRYETQAPAGVSRDDWLAGLARDRHIPLGRFGTPAEVAAAIVFLASPRAAYITGAALDVSGGNARHV